MTRGRSGSPTEAWLFYWGWSRVYDVMQPFFTSPEMREAGLDLDVHHFNKNKKEEAEAASG